MKTRGEAESEILKFLKSISVYSELSESAAIVLARACRFQQIKKGEILFFQSDTSELAYIVRSGIISIVLNSPDGRDMVINEMRAGDMFGELGILTKQPRSTSAMARIDSELLVIPCQVFLRIVDDEPQLARQLLDITASRLQRSGEREGALVFMDAQARLARLLLDLDKQEHEKGYITISQDELAHRTGLIRQTVAKALGKWRRQGLLLTGRGRIVLLDYKTLKELESKLLV
jgi:CRP/FNR family cyclic AMP-dependent transcriptional regulator